MKKLLNLSPINLMNSPKKTFYLLIFFLLSSCGQSNSEQKITPASDTTTSKDNTSDQQKLKAEQKQNPTDFLPKGYVVFEKINGDFNKDGIDDCVFIIKGTDKNQIIIDKDRGQLDRNRRGIIVLLKKNGQYELAVKNYDCFSSECEDGGVYFPPMLSVEIKNGNLFVHYAHGRYGYWRYNFRYLNSDFELIGYESSYGGAIVNRETSINFLSKKKLVKENTNDTARGGDEVFKETWEKIKVNKLIKLSEIKDFDQLDLTIY
jgi:hypothetical protein